MRTSSDKVRTAAESARPYVERALTDDEFRDSLRSAFVAAKQVYEELVPPRGVTELAGKVARDEEIQQSVKRAIVELRHAADRLQEEREGRGSHTMRNVLLILLGVAIGIFFNPFTGADTRRWVKGRVAGGEFSYDGHEAAQEIPAP
jgi:hypothetical protein